MIVLPGERPMSPKSAGAAQHAVAGDLAFALSRSAKRLNRPVSRPRCELRRAGRIVRVRALSSGCRWRESSLPTTPAPALGFCTRLWPKVDLAQRRSDGRGLCSAHRSKRSSRFWRSTTDAVEPDLTLYLVFFAAGPGPEFGYTRDQPCMRAGRRSNSQPKWGLIQ